MSKFRIITVLLLCLAIPAQGYAGMVSAAMSFAGMSHATVSADGCPESGALDTHGKPCFSFGHCCQALGFYIHAVPVSHPAVRETNFRPLITATHLPSVTLNGVWRPPSVV